MKFIVLIVAFVALFIPIECKSPLESDSVLESDLSRFCYHAGIEIGEKYNPMFRTDEDKPCSGAIISSTEIVTSNDCLRYIKFGYMFYYPSNITIRVGSANGLNGGVVRYMKEAKRLQLDDPSLDLAVITLNDPLPLGPTICTIRMAEKMDDDVYIKIGGTIEACGYHSRPRDELGLRQLQWITSPITDIHEKCPIFHYERRLVYMNGGPVVHRNPTNLTEEPVLLGFLSYGSSHRMVWETTVKISSFSKCIMERSCNNSTLIPLDNCTIYRL